MAFALGMALVGCAKRPGQIGGYNSRKADFQANSTTDSDSGTMVLAESQYFINVIYNGGLPKGQKSSQYYAENVEYSPNPQGCLSFPASWRVRSGDLLREPGLTPFVQLLEY